MIFGPGYIGNKFAARLPGCILTRVDITDRPAVRKALLENSPSAVINCAAKTGRPSIDWCEDHKSETIASNVLGPLVLATECLDKAVPFAHVGSGCVYAGDKGGAGYDEEDEPNFTGNTYTRSKILSERALRELPVLQLRLRMPVDGVPGPRNLITKLVQYRRVIDAPNSISVIDHFIDAGLELIGRGRTGIYNLTNPGAIALSRILEMYREIVDPSLSYEVVSPEKLASGLKANRTNCTLSTRKVEGEGIVMPPIEGAVRKTLLEYKRNLAS